MNKHLLLVHAHPDDESIGQGATMARYVAEGIGVTLVTCTGGEMGEILVPELEHMAADKDDTLADQRKIELDNAMKALGVTDYRYLGGFKRYRDSGMQWHADGHAVPADDVHENAFWNADLTEAASYLVEIIREVRPQVLVTYDEFGGYGHPDHIQAHRVATYAAALAAVPSYRPDLGEAARHREDLLGRDVGGAGCAQGLRDLRDAGDTTTFEGMDPDNLPAFMVEDDVLSAKLEADDYVDAKMEALRAHRTQISVDGPFFALSNNKGNEIWGTEFYRIAKGELGPTAGRRSGDGPVRWADLVSEKLGAKVAGFTVLGLLLLVGAALALLYFSTGDAAPRNARVEGISIAGLDPAEAEHRLRAGLADQVGEPVAMTYGDGRADFHRPGLRRPLRGLPRLDRASRRRLRVRPTADVGVDHRGRRPPRRDQRRPAADAGGRWTTSAKGSPRRLWRAPSTSSTGVPLRSSAGQGWWSLVGPPRRCWSATSCTAARRRSRREIREPEVSEDAVERALEEFGRPAMSGPVTLVLGGQRVIAPPRLFGKGLSMEAVDGELEPRVDGEVRARGAGARDAHGWPRARGRPDRGQARQATRRSREGAGSSSTHESSRTGSPKPPYGRERSDGSSSREGAPSPRSPQRMPER